MDSTLSLRVEVDFGVSSKQVCIELVQLANRLQIKCKTLINGVPVVAYPGSNAEELYRTYSDAFIATIE